MPVNAINHMPLQVLSTKAILVLLLYAAIVTVFICSGMKCLYGVCFK